MLREVSPPPAGGGACHRGRAVRGAGDVTAVLSVRAGAELLEEKIRGVRTMTSAIKAAARSVRLSMQCSGQSICYGTGS
jgi:predicted MarR family transcription regulator